MNKRNVLVYTLFWLVSTVAGVPAFGQIRDLSKLAVDVVHLKNKQQIRGFILGTNPSDELSVAVSCGWYEKTDREAYLQATVKAKQGADKARLQLRDRLKQRLEQPASADGQAGVPNGAFHFFLTKELERVNSEIQNSLDEEVQFLVLKFRSATVSSVSQTSASNRKIAAWSWYERLADVESRKPSSLNTELKARKIDATSTPPSLANRFYATEESEDQWKVRLSIVANRLDKPIEFQGAGESMFSIGSGQPLDLGSLMGQMMQSQVSSLLEELSGVQKRPAASKIEDTVWLQNAMAQAEKMNVSYFSATHVRTDTVQETAVVDSAFMVRMESGKWTTAWRASSNQTAAEQKEDAIRRVSSDPKIKAIQTQFESLGGSGGLMDKAIRMGAATMAAQRLVNEQFLQFSEMYLNRLCSPPIQLGK